MSYTPVINEPLDNTTPFPTMGTTAQRPIAPAVTQEYFDTTLDEPIWWNGSNWINAMGTNI
jgi:hypothetical protein